MELATEVWDDIPIEDLRAYMLKCEKTLGAIKAARGSWVSWGKSDDMQHGVGS